MRVNNVDFVVAWATSRTVEDVMKATGLGRPAIRYRQKVLTKAGVNLPKLQPAGTGLDGLEVAQLNSLIHKYKPRKVGV